MIWKIKWMKIYKNEFMDMYKNVQVIMLQKGW
jgi:hypothetical protein